MNTLDKPLPQKEQDRFTRGYCVEFAIALHQKTGWPLKVFVELEEPELSGDESPEEKQKAIDERGFYLIHACCETPNGFLIDARGPRREKDIRKNLLLCDLRPAADFPELVELRSMTVEDLEANFGVEEEALSLATKLLK